MRDRQSFSVCNLIKVGISCLCILAFLWILFSNTVLNQKTTSSLSENNQVTGNINDDCMVTQYFVPAYSYIEKIWLQFCCDGMENRTGNVALWLFDSQGKFVTSAKVPIADIVDWQYTDFTINANVEVGKLYAYTLYVEDVSGNGPKVVYRRLQTAGPEENRIMAYCNNGIDNASAAVRYQYLYKLTLLQICAYALFIAFIGVVVWGACKSVIPQKALLKRISVKWTCRVVLSVLILVSMGIAAYYTLVSKMFGGGKLDFIAYGLGITGLGGYLLLAVLKSKFIIPKKDKILNADNLRCVVRIMTIAYYIIQYADYYNSGIEYGHALATCHMNVAMGVFLLTFFSAKELFSIPTIIYSVIHMGFSCSWMFLHIYDTDTATLYKVAILATWAIGIVIIRTVINMIKGRVRRFSWVYTGLLILFGALMIVFRHGKQWPFLLIIYFGLFFVQKIEKSDMYRLLNHFAWGVILSFIYFTVQSLMYRPYHYSSYRYQGIFASESIWGVYLALVFSIVVIKLFVAHEKNKAFCHMWGYYLIYAFCVVYIIFSVSRTAILTITITAISFLVLCLLVNKKYFINSIRFLLLGLGITLFLLPGIYTLIRTIPAVVGKPLINRYEFRYEIIVLETDAPDSPKYMTVAKLLSSILDRISATLSGNNQMMGGRIDENGKWQTYPQEYLDSVDTAYDRSGGRKDIYMEYLKGLNFTGHDEISLEAEKETYVHAHNAFIQVAHDYGIITGIVFLIIGVFAVVRSFMYARNKSADSLFTLLPFTVIIAFGVASLTEWTFHPSIPFTLALFIMQAPLLSPVKKESVNEETGI